MQKSLVFLWLSKELVNKSWFAPVEGNQKPVRRCKCMPKQGFNMTDFSVLVQPEPLKENISLVQDNKLHIRLLAVHIKWDINSLFFLLLLLCYALVKKESNIQKYAVLLLQLLDCTWTFLNGWIHLCSCYGVTLIHVINLHVPPCLKAVLQFNHHCRLMGINHSRYVYCRGKL